MESVSRLLMSERGGALSNEGGTCNSVLSEYEHCESKECGVANERDGDALNRCGISSSKERRFGDNDSKECCSGLG